MEPACINYGFEMTNPSIGSAKLIIDRNVSIVGAGDGGIAKTAIGLATEVVNRHITDTLKPYGLAYPYPSSSVL